MVILNVTMTDPHTWEGPCNLQCAQLWLDKSDWGIPDNRLKTQPPARTSLQFSLASMVLIWLELGSPSLALQKGGKRILRPQRQGTFFNLN